MTTTKPKTDGLMIELTAAEISEGQFVAEINEALAEAVKILTHRRDSFRTPGKVSIRAEITVEFDQDMPDTLAIFSWVNTKTPKEESKTLAREAGGRLLVQPSGGSEDDPLQQKLFDPKSGRVVSIIDRATGEVRPAAEEAVVGKVGGA